MEFSFGAKKWLPREALEEKQEGDISYALGLHAPGFFDKVLNVDKCLLQSEPANRVFPVLLLLYLAFSLRDGEYIFALELFFARHHT